MKAQKTAIQYKDGQKLLYVGSSDLNGVELIKKAKQIINILEANASKFRLYESNCVKLFDLTFASYKLQIR